MHVYAWLLECLQGSWLQGSVMHAFAFRDWHLDDCALHSTLCAEVAAGHVS